MGDYPQDVPVTTGRRDSLADRFTAWFHVGAAGHNRGPG